MKDRSALQFFTAQAVVIDILLTVTVIGLVLAALGTLIVPLPHYIGTAAVVGLTLVAVGSLVARFVTRPDHLQAEQSHHILSIASRSLAHLSRGLSEETAQAVCRIALHEMETAAVAITDTETVLGFAGIGEDHHVVGGPILTRATHEVLESGEYQVLSNREDIGCPERFCVLEAAIVVPLMSRGAPVGTLKFYYTTPRLLNETQVTMAQGLAELLSVQLELSELERQTELATRMELQALQAQIHPHFLFNTINTIASLIRTDPVRARELLRQFAAFYRRTLDSTEDLVPLDTELEYARTYLGFEEARFGERLKIVERIDASAMRCSLPAFVIQPVVENCVQHGMRPRGPLTVRIEATMNERGLEVTIADDGVGMDEETLTRVLEPGFGKGLGIALKNVDDRLRGRFGPGSGVSVDSAEDRGTEVVLTVAHPDACD